MKGPSSELLKYGGLRALKTLEQRTTRGDSRVGIAALKKYLFSFFEIALGSEHAEQEGNLCLLR
jgi:hypothetical protein